MLASDLIKRARSLSDTPNSLFISHSDEINSLWESWKDIYEQITNSSDDYFITSVILSTTGATQLGNNEWELTIPSDVYKIRFIDWQNNGRWENMTKFNTNNRNKLYGSPQYRWRGPKLWIIASYLPQTIRIDYYPPPIMPSTPENMYQYLLTLPLYSVSTTVSGPQFYSSKNQNLSDNTDHMLYALSGTSIRSESATLNTNIALYTSTLISGVQYNAGFIYWLENNAVCRSSTDNVSTLTKTVISSGTVLNFSISNNFLYWATASNTYKVALDGSGPVSIYAYTTDHVCTIGTDVYYIRAGVIYKNAVSLVINSASITTDGIYLYYLDSLGNVHKYIGTTDIIIETAIIFLGSYQDNFLSVITTKYEVQAISVISDTDFIYPVNEANEILAYQCAIDFKRKQNGDITLLASRQSEIQNRLMSVLIRDSYQPERRTPESSNYWN